MNYDKLASRLNIEIVSVQLADPRMLAEILQRIALNYHDTASKVELTCNERHRDGHDLYTMRVIYISGSSIVIGCLRRSPKAEVEYHS